MKIVAVTACPTGIAHTYMAAEALEIAAKELGYIIKVETQGAVGVENMLTENDIKEADAVIIAADKEVDKRRFKNKLFLQVSTQEVLKDASKVIEESIKIKEKKSTKSRKAISSTSFYRHFMAGISVMVPFLVAGGVLYSLAPLPLAFKIQQAQDMAQAIRLISEMAFRLSLPVLSAYIAFSIGNVPALAPGMIGGLIVDYLSGGFLGALLTGFMAGYVVKFLRKNIKLHKDIEGFVVVFILPILSTFIIGVIYVMIFMRPLGILNIIFSYTAPETNSITAVVLGVVLGGMMAYDMGGPVNKIAYVIGVATLSSGKSSYIMAAVMAGGMVPPLTVGLVTLIIKNKFTENERRLGKTAILKGTAFITEGAVPFASTDPLRVMPSIIIGSSIAGVLSMLLKCTTLAPQGGIYALLIPGLIQNPLGYLAAVGAGVIFSSIVFIVLKLKL
jgi:fructose PTS system EIIBC or EIIC component